MAPVAIDFLLAPDGASVRRIRKAVAENAPGLYRIVGTWSELMAQVEAAYLLPACPGDWLEILSRAASRQRGAFWSSSFEVAPGETISELDSAIYRLLRSKGPGVDLQGLIEIIDDKSRLRRRLSDLSRLIETVDKLPAALRKMAAFLNKHDPPLRTFRVYYLSESMDLDTWQVAVLQKLKMEAPPIDPRLQAVLESSLASPKTANSALKAARHLYNPPEKPPANVDGVRIIAVRDSLAEAEIAAGLVQQALGKGVAIDDIGLLLPNDTLTLTAVEGVFKRCGLPLSGFRRSVGQRDLGRETVRQFLLCLRKPAPIMAMAALLTSPLMAWDADEGHQMARAVMRGNVMLRRTRLSDAARQLINLLDETVRTPTELQRRLVPFMAMLTADESLSGHLQRARETVERVQAELAVMKKLDDDWDKLLSLTQPKALSTVEPADYWQEAIPVFYEGSLPWCSVSHLYVLGFNQGHYPAEVGTSAVFTETEWDAIAEAGWPVNTNDMIRNRQRACFEHQLAAATDRLTLLLACRDAGGENLEPSSSLVFLARALGREPEDLVWNIDRSEDIRRIPDLPLAEPAAPSPPRELTATDIDLKLDLLIALSREDGQLAPLSPSAADTLMVSPFAWLLGWLGCEHQEWCVDDFDVMTAGTLAHSVFESLFQAGGPLPKSNEISKKIPGVLDKHMLQIAPYLRSPDWRVERFKFESEILEAALHWQQLLTSCKATIVAAEQWLRGKHGDVPLNGRSDLLVELPSGELLVVDYKKSSSEPRRNRMRSGFDLQAQLYRLMIQTGGLPGFDLPPDKIGVMYYLINDTTALIDTPISASVSVPRLETIDIDISSQAIKYLDRRLLQIRKGQVALNTTADEKWWKDNASLTIYALDNSPLIRLFMHDAELPS